LTTTNKERDEFNTNLKNVLISKFNTNDRIDIIDVRAVYKNNIDWAERYLTEDGLHQNKEGVKIMAKVINQYFE
jgi:lysophospholipase L1-like esterase